MTTNIDHIALESAFLDTSFDVSYWLNRETGGVLASDDWSESEARKLSSPDETDDPHVRLAWCLLWEDGEVGSEEPGEEERQKVKAVMDPLIPIPEAEPYSDYNLMVEFAATVRDRHLREMLEVALNCRGAFRRFKDVLARYPDERERWFEFGDSDLRRRVDAWLESVGLLEAEEDD